MTGRGDIPEGTVTVLFTDLVGSTPLNQRLGDEEARAIGRETEQLALERIEAHRGVVVKELGDGLMAVFSSARRAVACAREIQVDMARRNRRQTGPPVLVRIGLHTGEVIEENGDVHGETVIIARRLEGIAPPGGILASESVHMVLGTARGDLERAAAHVEHEDPVAWATAVALQAAALRGTGQVGEALRALGAALEAVPADGPTRAAIALQRATLLLELFRAAETLDDLAALVERHRSAGDRPRQLEALLALGRAHWILSLDHQDHAPVARARYRGPPPSARR